MKRNQWAIVRSCTLLMLLASSIFLPGAIVRAANVLPRVNASRDGGQSLSPRVAQDPEGNIHAIWNSEEGSRIVRYAKGLWDGNNYVFGEVSVIENVGSFQYSQPSVAVAPNGTIMAAWSASDGLRIKTWNSRDSSPGGGQVRLGPGISSSIDVDSQNRFHIVWSGDFQVQYCEWDGSRCTKRDSFADRVNRPDIAVDSNNGVHVVWDIGQEAKYRNRPAGGEWNASQDLGGGNFVQIAADGQGNAHIVRSSGFNIEYCRRTLTSDCVDGRTFDSGNDLAPSIGANKNGGIVVVFRDASNRILSYNAFENGAWTSSNELDEATTNPDVSARSYTNRFSVAWSLGFEAQIRTITVAGRVDPPAKPIGTVGIKSEFAPLLGGVGVRDSFDAIVLRATNGGPADKVTLTADGSSARTENFSGDSATVTGLSFSSPEKACELKTLRGTLAGPGGTSDEFSSTAWVDRAVDATATVVSQFGDPVYTNANEVRVRIASGRDECSGLASYTVDFGPTPGTGSQDPPVSPAQNFTIPTGNTVGIQLPSPNDGTYNFVVTVLDKAGLSQAYPLSVTKDRTTPVAEIEPAETITMTVEAGSLVRLNLIELGVQDNYLSSSGARYWGVRLLSLPTSAPVPSATDPLWATRGVVVPGVVPDLLRWNVLLGLNGTFTPNTDYTIYVQTLDGAGNASNVLKTNPVRIGDATGGILLPIIMR